MTNDQIILNFIKQYMSRNNYAPTYSEIQAGCGLSSKSHVAYWLNMLDANGMIRIDRNTPRGITIQFASFVRDAGSFGVVVLIQDKLSTDLIVDRWLCRNVTETEAHAVLTAQARTE